MRSATVTFVALLALAALTAHADAQAVDDDLNMCAETRVLGDATAVAACHDYCYNDDHECVGAGADSGFCTDALATFDEHSARTYPGCIDHDHDGVLDNDDEDFRRRLSDTLKHAPTENARRILQNGGFLPDSYGHHGACSGWNQCGNAQNCADHACHVHGFPDGATSHDGGKLCASQGVVCHLFSSIGSGPGHVDNLDWNWGYGCGDLQSVGQVVCCDVSQDADGDGVADCIDNCVNTVNADQTDSDSDGAGNACDACPNDPYDDADGDGVCGDVDNCPSTPNADQLDTDGDGDGDACDSDTDGDGIADGADACPLDAANDSDGDGHCANEDNCPTDANADQADGDGDGVGDVCDACNGDDATGDDDSDGVCNDLDVCEPSEVRYINSLGQFVTSVNPNDGSQPLAVIDGVNWYHLSASELNNYECAV